MKNIEIKNIPEVPSKIKRAVNDKKLAIFIGAGVSRFVGCTSWIELAKNLVEKCDIKPITKELLLKQSDSVKLISICSNILEDTDFMDEMKKSLKDKEIDTLQKDDDKFNIYRNLKNIGNIFITTNADRFIDSLLDASNIDIKNFDSKNIDNHRLYKIHGCVSDEKSLIFTKNKYIEAYASQVFIDFIDNIFANYTVLFVGYGLNEFELLDRIIKSIGPVNEPQHFFLNGYFQHEQEICNFEHKYFCDMGIEMIPFERDVKNYEQLIEVVNSWRDELQQTTENMQNNFDEIDKALENPNNSNITTIVQNIYNNNAQKQYFFSKAPNYQKLCLWLEPLNDKQYFALDAENENFRVLDFLKKVSIQNKDNEIKGITNLLLQIVGNVIDKVVDDRIVSDMIKIIFNLPVDKITLGHITFINSHFRKQHLVGDIQEIVIPVLIKNKKQKYMLLLLETIFGYTLNEKVYGNEVVSIIKHYWLKKLLKKHSAQIIDLVKIKGLKITEVFLKAVAGNSGRLSIATIRQKTPNEISQSTRYTNQYEKLLVFFIRDLLEKLSSNEIKPYIKKFLLEDENLIFQRLALHAINCKYDELKDIFWEWMKKTPFTHSEIITELWSLLKERSNKFNTDEFNVVINWIKSIDMKEHSLNEDENYIKKYNAYERKRWLLCLKDNNLKAKELYQKYNSIESEKIEHPEFYRWSSGGFLPPSHPVDLKKLCQDPIETINNFDPSKCKKATFTDDESLIKDVAKDLTACVVKDPLRFSKIINDFTPLDFVYKNSLIQGFEYVWQGKQEFNLKNVLDFIDNELSVDSFKSTDDKCKQWFIDTTARLIQEGTQRDDNAFDKDYLPKIKDIIFKLLDNKGEEKSDMFDEMNTHILSSSNGKVLHALVYYSLRYGRLNSSNAIKWEDDVKNFFTQQFAKDDVYSLLVFTILGKYLRHLQFLDKVWVEDNFNKIFPVNNTKLWNASMTAYFFHTERTQGIYSLFKNNGHIEKALESSFEKGAIKEDMISFICIAYINDIDSETIFDIINSNKKDNVLRIIRSLVRIYRKKQDKEIRDKVKKIWKGIYEAYKSSEDVDEIFAELTEFFVIIDKIEEGDMPLLVNTAKYTTGLYNSYQLIEEMARLSEKYPKEIGKIYKAIVRNKHFPGYEEEKIIKILNNLNAQDRLEIINSYREKGIYKFNEIGK